MFIIKKYWFLMWKKAFNNFFLFQNFQGSIFLTNSKTCFLVIKLLLFIFCKKLKNKILFKIFIQKILKEKGKIKNQFSHKKHNRKRPQ